MDFELLLTLARAPGQVLTRRQLLAAVSNDDVHTDGRVVDVHIRTLRRALANDATHPAIIDTVRSVGYRFLPHPAQLMGPAKLAGVGQVAHYPLVVSTGSAVRCTVSIASDV